MVGRGCGLILCYPGICMRRLRKTMKASVSVDGLQVDI
jgi:hypothetical protein